MPQRLGTLFTGQDPFNQMRKCQHFLEDMRNHFPSGTLAFFLIPSNEIWYHLYCNANCHIAFCFPHDLVIHRDDVLETKLDYTQSYHHV